MYASQELSIIVQARARLDELVTELAGTDDGLAIGDKIKAFLECFKRLPAYSGYKHIPESARAVQLTVSRHRSETDCRKFLYACMLQGLLNSLSSSAFSALPTRIKGHQLKQYIRILEKSTVVTDTCEVASDLFQKDFGLAVMRLYAAASQLVDCDAGIGRAILLCSGLGQLPQRLALFARLGGFKPFFEIHTHLSYLDEFNEEGWNECYRCCADLYSVFPNVLGMQGGSWFYDPALTQISPRLAYLQDIPQRGGAHLLFTSADTHLVHDATSTSPTRKQLYDEGKYQPKSYTLIWSRSDQRKWAQAHPNTPLTV
jgi:hypothetical protein